MNKEQLIKELSSLGINLSNEQLEQLEKFKNLVREWNEKFNLTNILEENEFNLKHIYDSLCLVKAFDSNKSLSLCDIGTGAGFPGIVLKIVFNNLNITLVESNSKKCEFLKFVIASLEQENISVINERAEIFARSNIEKYDLVTSRAVSNMKILIELSLPILKINGLLIPLKGNILEIEESKKVISKYNAELIKIIEYKLPIENANRCIPIIIKVGKTNSIYPRDYNQIIKEYK